MTPQLREREREREREPLIINDRGSLKNHNITKLSRDLEQYTLHTYERDLIVKHLLS
jgi:hypothetical protein